MTFSSELIIAWWRVYRNTIRIWLVWLSSRIGNDVCVRSGGYFVLLWAIPATVQGTVIAIGVQWLWYGAGEPIWVYVYIYK